MGIGLSPSPHPGGGGGPGNAGSYGGSGGSGIVIIRYKTTGLKHLPSIVAEDGAKSIELTNLVAWYKFDEVLAGNQLKDETGNYNLNYTSTNNIIDSVNGIIDSSMIKDSDTDSVYTNANFPSITNTTIISYFCGIVKLFFHFFLNIFIDVF